MEELGTPMGHERRVRVRKPRASPTRARAAACPRRPMVEAAGTAAMVLLMAACGGGSPAAAPRASGVAPTPSASSSTPSPTGSTLPSPTAADTDSPAPSPTLQPVPTTPSPSAAGTAVTSLLIPESTANYDFGQTIINGIEYAQALKIYPQNTPLNVQIDAGRSHHRFRGSLGIPDNQSSSASYEVDISLDNAAPVYSTVVNFGETKSIDLDVTHALRIKITVLWRAGQNGAVAIGDPTLG